MIKNECEIVKDLMPSYIENLATEGTKNFIKEHIKNCEPCKEMLENLKQEKEQQKEQKEKQNGEIEINHLKKYHKQVEKLKTTLFTIAIVLILICLAILGKLINKNLKIKKNEQEGQKVIAMIEEAERNTRFFLELRDYTLNIEEKKNIGTQEETKRTYVYKKSNGNFFGKYEERSKEKIQYGYKTYLFNDSRTLKGIFEGTKGDVSLWEMDMSDIERSVITCAGFLELKSPHVCVEQVKIREEEWEGKKCKVFSRHISENSHYELWVEAENNIIIRDLVIENGNITEEKNYKWKEGTVSDKEIFDGASVEEIKNKYYDLNKKANQVAQIINEAYSKTEKVIKSGNYTLTVDYDRLINIMEKEKGRDIYKVKDKKYSITKVNEGSIIYGIADKEYRKELEIKDKKILREEVKVGDITKLVNIGIYNMNGMSLSSYAHLELKEEQYNGKNCYAISDEAMKIWIDKESKLIQGYTFRINGENMTDIETYTWEIGNVTDKDVLEANTIEEAKKAYGYEKGQE